MAGKVEIIIIHGNLQEKSKAKLYAFLHIFSKEVPSTYYHMNSHNQQEPSPSPGGSNLPRSTNLRNGGAAPEQSNLQDLSQS